MSRNRGNTVFDWKDGEYQYCYDLVANGGDKNVPRYALKDYLNVQVVSAVRDQRLDVVGALVNLIDKVQS